MSDLNTQYLTINTDMMEMTPKPVSEPVEVDEVKQSGGYMNKDLNDYLKTADISDSTRTNYINDYNRLRLLLNNNKSLYNISQKDILTAIKSSENSQANLLNIAIVILRSKDKPNTKLITYREKIFEERKAYQNKKNQKLLNTNDVDFNKLNEILDKSVGNDYLLFYLLMNFNVRNADMAITIADKNKIKEVYNKNDNFMVVYPNKVIYIRQDYKTKDIYGAKKHIIKDKKFVLTLKNRIAEGYTSLFTNNKNQPLKVNEMNNHIKRRYAKFLPEANMSQSLIYKIIQNHYEELGDIKKLQEIAELRGHRIDTQLNNYSSTI